MSSRVPTAGSRVLLVCPVGVEATRRSGGSGRHCAKSLAVGLVVAPWEEVQSVSEVQSFVSIVGYLPLAPVKVDCVSLTGGQVGGHLDAGTSEFVSQVPVVHYRHLLLPSVELYYGWSLRCCGAPTRKARLTSARCQHGEVENSFKTSTICCSTLV